MLASLAYVLGCSGGDPSDGSGGIDGATSGGSGGMGRSGGSGGMGGSGGSAGEGGGSAGAGSGCEVSEIFPGLCTCVIKQDGTLWCWGAENCIANDAEDGDELAQITVPGGVLTLDVAGSGETLAVNRAGELFYWGEYEPDPVHAARAAAGTEREPVRFPDTPAGIRKVAIDNDNWFCVLRDDNDVSCWDDELDTWQSLTLGGAARIMEISAAPWSVCGLDAAGAVHCAGPSHESCAPVQLDFGGESVVSLRKGCAVTESGAVYCGVGDENDAGPCLAAPVPVPDVSAADYAEATFNQCYVTLEGGIRCQGRGGDGELGNDGYVDRTTFVDVDLWAGKAKRVTLGITPCAVLENDRLWCWGNGLPEPGPTRAAIPTMVPLCAGDPAPTPPAPTPLDSFVDVTGTPSGAVELTDAVGRCEGLDVGTVVYRRSTNALDYGVCGPTGLLERSGSITGFYGAQLHVGMFEYVDEAYPPPEGQEKGFGVFLWSQKSGINQTSCISNDGAMSGGRSRTVLGTGDEACGAKAIVLSTSPFRIQLNFTHRRFAEIELRPVPGTDAITMP
ncbi:RCC1 domain-containing protein [Sorangium sp. So ce1099]|uniref:RCC1 domain-containing protein n=1 Tax=Sorangium sp. So ce1099 TaxID=3133331 RepID=UPI003F5DEC73